MVPVKAITEKLEAEVVFNEATKTLAITKDTAVIQITSAGITATIDGSPVDITDRVQVTCGRTYIPLDLLAEILNLDVSFDSDNGIIDVDVPVDETPVDNGTTETPVDDATTDPVAETPVVELTPDPVVPELEPII